MLIKDKNIKAVNSYFSNVASNYISHSVNFPWSFVRKRESNKVKRVINKTSLNNVLELGSGAGFYTTILLNKGAKNLYAVDLSESMLKNIKKNNVHKICINAENLLFNKNFDTIFSAGMIEFLDNPRKIFLNAKKMSNNKTKFIMLLPSDGFCGKMYKKFHHNHNINISLFNRNIIEKLIKKSGWIIEEYIHIWPIAILVNLERDKI